MYAVVSLIALGQQLRLAYFGSLRRILKYRSHCARLWALRERVHVFHVRMHPIFSSFSKPTKQNRKLTNIPHSTPSIAPPNSSVRIK